MFCLNVYMCVPYVCLDPCRGQERALDSLSYEWLWAPTCGATKPSVRAPGALQRLSHRSDGFLWVSFLFLCFLFFVLFCLFGFRFFSRSSYIVFALELVWIFFSLVGCLFTVDSIIVVPFCQLLPVLLVFLFRKFLPELIRWISTFPNLLCQTRAVESNIGTKVLDVFAVVLWE